MTVKIQWNWDIQVVVVAKEKGIGLKIWKLWRKVKLEVFVRKQRKRYKDL
jgi:hypothetical protein